MASGTPTLAGKCVDLYEKLNTFVTNVITRDVTPKITNLNTEVWGSNTQTGESRIDALEVLTNNLESDVNSLDNSITNLCIVQEKAVNMGSIGGGGNSTKTTTVTACPTGYSSMIVVKNLSWGILSSSSISGTTLSLTAQNPSASSHTCWITVYVIYYPSSWNI